MLAAVVASWRCCVNLVTVLALVSVPVAKARSRGVFRGPAHSVGMLGCKWSPILCAMALAHAKAVEPQSRTCRANRQDSGAAAAAVRPFGGMSGLLWAARANLQAVLGFVVAAPAIWAAYCGTGVALLAARAVHAGLPRGVPAVARVLSLRQTLGFGGGTGSCGRIAGRPILLGF